MVTDPADCATQRSQNTAKSGKAHRLLVLDYGLNANDASGTLAKRPALSRALEYLREGDTLVVTKLDRLGRSVGNLKDVADQLQNQGVGLVALSQGIDTTTAGGRLFFHMLAAIAEFEHDLIVERTRDGLAAARARGRKGGPKFKMTPTKAKQARAMYDAGEHTVQEIAETFGVSRPTIYRHLGEDAERR
ncbi:recombinase family protein [Kocuria sp. TGY1127_2]|uniref:recombinase family protein n=1 Tax=Kocuria sp. TGY1127_2 TaxID=2711328 RepID=UPI0015B89D53|nr:recombinase family protein [Kocuria sp. TGY1127_2]